MLEGAIAAVLLIAGTLSGGDALSAIQTASVTAGLPFCVVLLMTCVALYKGLSEETSPGQRSQNTSRAVGPN